GPLVAALDYAERGWMVFPLHTVGGQACSCGSGDCSNPGKHPRTRYGVKDATTDPEQIRIWWSSWPDANVGIATGAGSGLVVLDLDAKAEGEASLAALEAVHDLLPPTVTASTGGGGRHLLFAHPGVELRNSAGKLGAGLDVRGDGGYVVASPSRHS